MCLMIGRYVSLRSITNIRYSVKFRIHLPLTSPFFVPFKSGLSAVLW